MLGVKNLCSVYICIVLSNIFKSFANKNFLFSLTSVYPVDSNLFNCDSVESKLLLLVKFIYKCK
jgi:hypothetical protein